jgi:hypothetical protein
MMSVIEERIERYLFESNRHIEHIESAKDELSLPIKKYDSLNKLEKFALNTLIFRFSKLQDLIGGKLFRNYLNFSGLNTDNMSFFDILKELEKESVIDIDSWNELRELRNDIAYEYPQEIDEMIEKVNLLVEKSFELIKIFKNIEKKYYEIKRKRD